jgi:hypothetical protein
VKRKWEAAYVASHVFAAASGTNHEDIKFVVTEPGCYYEHDLEHRRFADKELMHPAEAL